MRISLFVKIISLMAFLTIIPLLILGFFVMKDFSKVEKYLIQNLKEGNERMISNSTKALDALGEKIIMNQALAVKKMVELYIKNHPSKSAAELIADPEFQAIAIQPVGQKGYTTVIQTKTQNIIAHPNTSMMDRDLLDMKDDPKMTDWWKVVESTWRNNVDSSGYYAWPEPDGSYSNKYMYLAVIGEKLEGSIDLSVAATTYMNEFNAPVNILKDQMSESENFTVQNLNTVSRDIQKNFFILIIVMSAAVIVVGIFLASSITRPIKKLKIFSQKINEGKFEEADADIKSNDEFSDLGGCFNTMARDLEISRQNLEENNKELEERVKKRTMELQQKNDELKKFNKIAVDREIKMVELKNKIMELEKEKNTKIL
jgi:nitrogen fixation/metabolism regulation signal transduction histidine kinase